MIVVPPSENTAMPTNLESMPGERAGAGVHAAVWVGSQGLPVGSGAMASVFPLRCYGERLRSRCRRLDRVFHQCKFCR